MGETDKQQQQKGGQQTKERRRRERRQRDSRQRREDEGRGDEGSVFVFRSLFFFCSLAARPWVAPTHLHNNKLRPTSSLSSYFSTTTGLGGLGFGRTIRTHGAGMNTHTTLPLHCIAPAPALQGLHPVTDDRVVHRRGGCEGRQPWSFVFFARLRSSHSPALFWVSLRHLSARRFCELSPSFYSFPGAYDLV